MTTRLCFGLLTLALALPAGASEWREGSLFLRAGLDYRTGDFGRDEGDTDIWALPLGIEYRFANLGLTPRDRVRVRLGLPLLSVDGPERGQAGRSPSDDRDTGPGDLSLRAFYLWVPDERPDWPFVELSGRIKFPTASESKDLGTGEFDFGADVRVSKPFRPDWLGRRITPWVRVGYKIVGEPDNADRDNVWRTTTGGSVRLSDDLALGLRYAWRESSTGRGNRASLTPFASVRVNERVRVSPYLGFGLSKDAADWGAGFQVRYEVGGGRKVP